MKRSIHIVPTRLALSVIPPPFCSQWQTSKSSICAARHASTDSLPRVARPSLWQNIVPKAFRPAARASTSRVSRWQKSRLVWRNPATVFIAFGLMMGSNAINLLLLRNAMANYSRKADAKIALLREVFERVQRGEEVDVEGLLGTGNEESDQDWNEVLEEIEGEERSWQSRKRKKANSAEALASQDRARSRSEAPPSAAPPPSSPDSKDGSSTADYLVPIQQRVPVQFL